jgi:DNA-binding CsgD family transcriptional regulator/tetratricopeptide (TPR) repeat protein
MRSATGLVGRRRELRELRADIDEAVTSGQPRLAVVTGEAGVGKTRLLAEITAAVTGGTVLRAQARQRSWPSPFQLVRECLEPVFLGWDDLPEELARVRHALSHLMAPHVDLFEHPQDGHDHQPAELIGAASAVLRYLSSMEPVVLVVEDLQWGDEESLEMLLRFLEVSGPLAVLVSYRSSALGPGPLAPWLEHASRAPVTRFVEVGPLSVEETATFAEVLIGRPVARGLAEALHDRTDGNPYFIEELWASARSHRQGGIHAESLLHAPLSGTARDVVAERVGRLDPPQRDVVERASALGVSFPFELLAAVLDLGHEQLLPVLRDLIDAGLFVEQGPDRFAFRHALTREAVAEGLLHRERTAIHRQALQVLQSARMGDVDLLVHHALGADDIPALVAHAERGAVEALARGAHRHAFRLASKAAEHASESIPLQMVLSRAALLLGDLDAAIAHAAAWEALTLVTGTVEEHAEACCHRAWAHWSRGQRDEGWAALERGRPSARAEAGPSVAGAWWEAVSAQLHLHEGRADEAMAHADRAVSMAQVLGDQRILVHARTTQGVALVAEPPAHPDTVVPEAARRLAEARHDAARRGDMEALTRAYHNSILPGQGIATMADSRRLIEEARPLIDLYGLVRFGRKLEGLDAYLATLEGDLVRAGSMLAGWSPGGSGIDDVFMTARAAIIASEAGDLDRARGLLASCGSLDQDSAVFEQLVDTAEAESYLAAASGDAELAATALRRVGEVGDRVGTAAAAAWWDIAANALRTPLDLELVRRSLEHHAPPIRERTGHAAAHVRGRLAAARGEDDLAADELAFAVREPQGSRPEALRADARAAYAIALARCGEVAEARAQASEARELLVRWPGWRREELDALLERLGRGHGGGKAASVGLLTPREAEVCRLVAAGLTNGEIAGRLFISPKTASVHVSNILRKTGLERRTQLAAWAHRQGRA